MRKLFFYSGDWNGWINFWRNSMFDQSICRVWISCVRGYVFTCILAWERHLRRTSARKINGNYQWLIAFLSKVKIRNIEILEWRKAQSWYIVVHWKKKRNIDMPRTLQAPTSFQMYRGREAARLTGLWPFEYSTPKGDNSWICEAHCSMKP